MAAQSTAAILAAAAGTVVAVDGWDPHDHRIIRHLETAAGDDPDAAHTAYQALSDHLMCPAGTWELLDRSQHDVADALMGAAREVTA
ncbi:hypothetical protein ACL02U_11820 [Streptomyces sp. MS06]|uniref:hypothetical protein n=1 Tax=Streptomyces sp. MS06 TaxID=3385974 RepID=UPI00399FE885